MEDIGGRSLVVLITSYSRLQKCHKLWHSLLRKIFEKSEHVAKNLSAITFVNQTELEFLGETVRDSVQVELDIQGSITQS